MSDFSDATQEDRLSLTRSLTGLVERVGVGTP